MSTISLDEKRQRNTSVRVPPHNLDAERALLGAMLLSQHAIDMAMLVVNPDSFYRPAHGHIYDTIVNLRARGEPADTVTVADRLRSHGLLDAAGGLSTLLALQADTPGTSGAGRYARIVADRATMRRLVSVGGDLAELGYEAGDDVAATLDQAERLVLSIATGRADDSNTESYGQTIDAYFEQLEEACANGRPAGLKTGWVDLDHHLNSLRPGNCVVIAARPSTGKTAFALNLACKVAFTDNEPVFFASMEMVHDEIKDRIVAAQARVPLSHIIEAQVQAQDWERLERAREAIRGNPNLWFDDTPSPTMLQIAAKARRIKAARGSLGMIVMDYAELVGDERDETEALRVAQIARGAKQLAKDLNCVVVLLSQVKRAVEERSDKRPGLSDLSASGGLEAAADVVMCLYRDELYDPETNDKGITEVLIRKARQGATGTVKLAYLGHYVSFQNMARL